jgi:plasmid stabilization system protein ParE
MGVTRWTPIAQEDLERVYDYIGHEQQSQQAAAQVVRDIVAKSDLYAAAPMLAGARPELGPDLRSFFVHRYVII